MGSSLPLTYLFLFLVSFPDVLGSHQSFTFKKKLLLYIFLEEPTPRTSGKFFSSVEGFICRSPQGVSYSESHSLAALVFVSLLPTSHLSALWVPEMKNPVVSSLLVPVQLTQEAPEAEALKRLKRGRRGKGPLTRPEK